MNLRLLSRLALPAWFAASLTDATAQSSFTKITTGSVVTDLGASQSCAWTDFNNDGHIDLFVANYGSSGTGRNFLYQNNGDGTFTKLTANSVATATGEFAGGVWGDFDNDGLTDLFVMEYQGKNSFYRNRGNGVFDPIPNPVKPNPTPDHFVGGAAWGDFDNDGSLDLFVAMTGIKNLLYRNKGNGTFALETDSSIANGGGNSTGGNWGDYDNDGRLDLFVPNVRGENDYLYHNNSDGTLAQLTAGPVVNEAMHSWGGAWGDYNNDGFLDLFVPVYGNRSRLYENKEDGTFQPVNGAHNAVQSGSAGAAWGDYDNDGFLDLFVANGIVGDARNFLVHNNGDGTFTRITTGAPVTDSASSVGAAWGDYDNDGALDLFVANGNLSSQRNFLYRNNGNTNHWLKVKLVGTASNRSAIGAKIRLQANIGGKLINQMRELSGGTSISCQDDPRAHFGLADALSAAVLRIEWPSGFVQELASVPANQILTIVEPPLGLRRGQELGLMRWSTAIAVAGNYAFVAGSYDESGGDGLRVVDISDPNRLSLLQTGLRSSGTAFPGLQLNGNLLLWSHSMTGSLAGATRPRLTTVDVSDPLQPRELGHWDDSREGTISRTAVNGSIAYLAWSDAGGTDGGVVMLDFSDPSALREIGRYAVGEKATAVDVAENLVFLATVDGLPKGTLRILSDADPGDVRPIAILDLGNLVVTDLKLVGDTAYLAGSRNVEGLGSTPEIVIASVKVPANPVQLGSRAFPDARHWLLKGLDISNGRAFLACHGETGSRGGLIVLDVREPNQITIVDTWGYGWGDGGVEKGVGFWGVNVAGSRVYCVGRRDSDGMFSFDLKPGLWLDTFRWPPAEPLPRWLSWRHESGIKLQGTKSLTNPVWEDVSLGELSSEGRVFLGIVPVSQGEFFRLFKP